MSFNFNWPTFSDEFRAMATQQLEIALNKGEHRPSHICDDIRVKELFMGTTPPDLEMMEVGELTMERFRGMFRFTYGGDAYLVLQTKVQVNPVTPVYAMNPHESFMAHSLLPFPSMQAAQKPLVVPMQLRLSQLRLRGIMTLVTDRSKGVTLSFKNDPLESVSVSSTFDDLVSVKKMLQNEIENQLQQLFSEQLPVLIHELSLKRMGIKEKSVEDALRRSSTMPLGDEKSGEQLQSPYDSYDSGLGMSVDDGLPSLGQVRSSGGSFFSNQSTERLPTHPADIHIRALASSARNSPEKVSLGVGTANQFSSAVDTRAILFSSLPSLKINTTSSPTSPTTVRKQFSAEERKSADSLLDKSPQKHYAHSVSVPTSPKLHHRDMGIESKSSVGCSSIIHPPATTSVAHPSRHSRIIHASHPSIRSRHFDTFSDTQHNRLATRKFFVGGPRHVLKLDGDSDDSASVVSIGAMRYEKHRLNAIDY